MVSVNDLRALALSFDDVNESPHFHRTSFRYNKKIFATCDVQKKEVTVMLSPEEQSVFCAINAEMIYPVPGAWGQKGATFISLQKVNKSILRDALQRAYSKIAEKKKNKIK